LDNLLRQLILRLSQSQHRSTLFVSRLRARTHNDNAFYAALIAHAQGDANGALSELSGATAKDFETSELLPLWQVANKLRFVKAEQAVAVQIRARISGNTWVCLFGVDTLIRVGDFEGANRELMRLARHGDAPEHIGRFVELSLTLKRPEVIEAFLSDTAPHSDRVSILFRQVGFYRRLGDRPGAFRKCLELARICAGSPEELRRVATDFLQLGERSSALEILERLLPIAPGDHPLALDLVDALIPSDLPRAHAELVRITSTSDLPTAAWERASGLFERLKDLDAALRSIKAAAMAPGSRPYTRQRLAALLARMGHTRAAKDELLALLSACRKDPYRLRALGGVALTLPDLPLAVEFAEAQFRCDPTNPESIMHLARQVRMGGDRLRARELLSALLNSERRSPSMSDQHWIQLAQELYETGDAALTKDAVAEVLARQPTNEVALGLAATAELLDRFRAPAQAATPQARREPVRSSRVSKLARFFRR
jgi:tetratricopeptide (TPR) repeat protein